eukprot:scaffold571_cov76-Skeletonema_menzelii.AAC.2
MLMYVGNLLEEERGEENPYLGFPFYLNLLTIGGDQSIALPSSYYSMANKKPSRHNQEVAINKI